MPAESKVGFRTLLRATGSLLLVFLCLQVVRPELKNPPVTEDLQAPPAVKKIFRTACYNCHSNETKLSWFDWPVPAYWLVTRDVREARRHLNFSEIGNLPAGQQKAILFESVSLVQLGAMPLPAYKRAHPDSVISPEQLAALKEYLNPDVPNEAAGAAEVSAADAEYDKWIQAGSATPEVAPAPNGIAFIPEYKNWKTISSTERYDNHTIRQILGNEVAVRAIAQNHINPWPDGTEFAKVAWLQEPDEQGLVRTGAFFQVEFMVRDSKKYARTLGWGFARWRGADLKPYGKDADFTRECVGCHQPLKNTDSVYTLPIRGQS